MKKIVLSLVALLTSLSVLTCFVAHCADEDLTFEEIIKETIDSMLISSSGLDVVEDGVKLKTGFEGLFAETYLNAYESLWLDPNNSDGYLEFTVPNIDIVTGKYMLHWTLEDGSQDDVLVECTIILSDKPDYLADLPPIKVREYGDVYYYANALNYMITHTDGTVNRYVVVLPVGFNYNNLTISSTNITTGNLSGCTLYEYSGGSDITKSRPLRTAFYVQGLRFNVSEVNSIRQDFNELVTPSSALQQKPFGFASYSTQVVSPSSPLTYPHDIDICSGGVYGLYHNLDNPSRYSQYSVITNRLFMCSFATTNNSTKGNNLNRYWITPQTQNYYYNDYIQGGTTINETNVNNYFDGAFLPAFDIDPDLPLDDIIALLTDLAPDFQLAMRPTLDLSTGALFDRLVDFYGNMPDINLDWDTPLDNDYWDIEFPPVPDSGGGGSGGDITVNVDITRPLVPKVTTNYWLDLDVGTQTTQTYPVAVVSAAPQVFDKADEVVDTLEIMPLIGLLAVFSVAVAILFKGV